MNEKTKKTDWKQKVIHEFLEYWINVIYLALFFGVFISYRRLILAQYQISYIEYGVSIIEALVLAKIIMIGTVLRIGQRFQEMPLIIPTIFRSFIFSIWVAIYKVLEHTVVGLVHGKGLTGGINELIGRGGNELVAGCLVIFFAFIPFFAVKELGRVMGEGKLAELFLRRRAGKESNFDTATYSHTDKG